MEMEVGVLATVDDPPVAGEPTADDGEPVRRRWLGCLCVTRTEDVEQGKES